jgi:Exo-beta-D-glucosaminidase Ig-fold domain/Malectin domain/Glycosyl hydrolases family 2/Glycosyl hydrolases family 2, sugar binding domain/Glycosyl hydrolases family 2, TIM barrel domain
VTPLLLILGSIAVHAQAASAEAGSPVELNSGWLLQSANKLSMDGGQISTPQGQGGTWLKAVVPGTVLTSLVADGVYPDPLFGENNRPDRIPDDLAKQTYWYRDEFNATSPTPGRHVWLYFQGVNYIAEVWLNGRDLGSIRGAFARGRFDATEYLVKSGTNVLAVQITPPPDPGKTHEKTQATGTGPNGGILSQDGPTFLCSLGWDWIPTIRDRNIGIWQGVWLESTGPVLVQDPYVESKLPLPDISNADLTITADLKNATNQAQQGTFKANVAGIEVRLPVSLAPGEAKTVRISPQLEPSLHIQHPKLWWPNGFGPQNLTQLKAEFDVEGGVSDSKEIMFGIRQMGYSVPGSDNLTLTVNGVPVVAKGGDWGMDEAMKRIPVERLDAMIRMHRDANYTIIRNWVGQSTSNAFYDLCDKYGILIWDEFFQPNPSDGPNPVDPDMYLANVRDKILRYRYHPCVALWCARNEGNPPEAIGKGIEQFIHELDPTRLYQASSTDGRGVRSGGPYRWRTPKEYYDFNEPFKTEIGSMSVPTLESIKAMMPASDLEVINDDWAEHDFCAGAQDGGNYPYELASRFGAPANLADFVRKAQVANYEAFRAMYEGRLCKLFQPTSGVITWMSNPAQPSFVWQLYAHDLEPNSSLFGVKEACEPVHVMLNEVTNHLMVVNNTASTYHAVVAKAVIYNLLGAVRQSVLTKLDLEPSSVADGGEIDFHEADLSDVYFVELNLSTPAGKLLSHNFYWRAKAGHPDDLSALAGLPMASLAFTTHLKATGGRSLTTVDITNRSHSVALMTHLQLRTEVSQERVLPVFYSDNYISLVPGQTRRVTIEADVKNLLGQTPMIAVDGWNAEVGQVAGPVKVALNRDAAVFSSAPVPASPPDHVRIECGTGPTGFYRFGQVDSPEDTRDRDFEGGYGMRVRGVLQGEVKGARVFPTTYRIPVDRRYRYTVVLTFLETRFQAGERKFNVDINGSRLLSDFDIAAEAGPNKPDVKTFPGIAPNADGKIVIALTKGSVDQPTISGIEIRMTPNK